MIEIDLGPLINQLLIDYQKARNAPRIDPNTGQPKKWSTKNKIFISNVVATDCDKQIRYAFEGVEKDADEEEWPGLENEIGTLIHDKIQQAFMARKGLAEIEKKIDIELEGIKINMKVDGVFHNGNLLEMKTLGPKDYEISKPREKDFLQVNFYMGILKVDTAIITYLKRDNGKHIKSFQVNFDREKYKKLMMRICNIIKDKNLRYNKRSCRFCKYTEHCKKEGRPW